MFKNILVPVMLDHGDAHEKALEAAAALRDGDGTVTLLHVLEAIPSWVSAEIPKEVSENRLEDAKKALQEMANAAGQGIDGSVIYGHAGRTIVEYAEAHGNDCIIISSHQPGLQDYFLGSTAARVVRHAGCSVMVLR